MPKLLILSSNPRRDLNLEREVSDLVTAIQRVGKFEIALGLGVQSQELLELLAEHSPQIVHFCGHGAGKQGLVFQDEKGRECLVSNEVLARLFKTFSNEINCAVLNACDSEKQAEVIVESINYVIGMSEPILDEAAYYFATGFYQGLANGKSIEQSYELGCIAVQIWSETNVQTTQSRKYRKLVPVEAVASSNHLPEHLKPVLWKKEALLPSSSEASTSAQIARPLSALPNLPSNFVEAIQQEIDRKDYKDQARAAYDNFGQFSAEYAAANLTKTECAQRKILVSKVKQFWIEGFLNPSIQGNAAISLDLKARPEAIANLSQGIEALSVELDDSYEELRETRIYEDMGRGRTLLILGEPGAGKTIALLQLAQNLIERTEQDLSLPIPVVFNLSSWAQERKSIVDWLIDELREKYQVPKSLSDPWITQQQLILLLDGLDEVKEDYRNDCVLALNKFIGLFPQTEIAVCSRVRDYEALTEHLQLSSALCLQPLACEQIYQFLDQVGGALAGLKTLLKRDTELERFAQTPLILNFMSVAYQGWSVERLMREFHTAPDRAQHLFDTYVNRRLDRGATSIYSSSQVLCWLSWLAARMMQEKRTIFLIERIQPTWLENRSEKRNYQTRAFIPSFLFSGIHGLVVGFQFGLNAGLPTGLACGLMFGPILGLIVGSRREINLLERVSWSWQRARLKFLREFLTAFGYVLIIGLLIQILPASLITKLNLEWIRWSKMGLPLGLLLKMGLPLGLLFGISGGLGSSEIGQRTAPNQGVQTSLRNCLMIGISVLVLSVSLGGLSGGFTEGLIFGLMFGPLLGLKYGGTACIQHFTLRQTLYQKGHIPWNYAKFLDFASDRLLMKKIGGGYVFFHRMLLEHFAQMNPIRSQPRASR